MKILETVDHSPCSKTLTIDVPIDEINKEVETLYKELTAHAQIPGFRPGRAPLHFLKMRFGRKVMEEAREKATEKACQDAIKELDLRLVGEPKVTPCEEPKEGEEKKDLQQLEQEPLCFKFEFEYLPVFEPAAYDQLQIEIPAVVVGDEQIDGVLENFRHRAAMLVPAPEGKAIEPEDIIMLSVEASCEGEPFTEATHDDYMMEVGSKQHLPGFEEALLGLKVGDKKSIEQPLPENYHLEKYRGKQALFEIKVKQINQRKLPDLDDEFAKDLDFDTLDQLKAQVREDLEKEAEKRAQQAKKATLRSKLSEMNDIPVPDTMVDAEFRYINSMQSLQLAYMGSSFDALGDKQAEILAENRNRAVQTVRSSLVLEKIAEKEEIKIGETEFLDYLEATAEQQGEDVDRFVSNVHKKGTEAYYQRQAIEDKVLDFLLQRTEIKEIQPDVEKSEPKKTARKKKAEKKKEKEA